MVKNNCATKSAAPHRALTFAAFTSSLLTLSLLKVTIMAWCWMLFVYQWQSCVQIDRITIKKINCWRKLRLIWSISEINRRKNHNWFYRWINNRLPINPRLKKFVVIVIVNQLCTILTNGDSGHPYEICIIVNKWK